MKYMFVIVLCVHFYVSAKSNNTPQIDCSPCDHGKQPSPACHCVYPFTGTLYFRAPSFSTLLNSIYFLILHQGMVAFLKSFNHPPDIVAIRNIRRNEYDHQLLIDISVFPLGAESFTQMTMTLIGFAFSNQDYKPPAIFGPYIFKPNMYHQFSDGGASKSPHRNALIGLGVGASFLMLILVVAGVYSLNFTTYIYQT